MRRDLPTPSARTPSGRPRTEVETNGVEEDCTKGARASEKPFSFEEGLLPPPSDKALSFSPPSLAAAEWR
eukprot:7144399-Pyramimonas_sp.AAC.1